MARTSPTVFTTACTAPPKSVSVVRRPADAPEGRRAEAFPRRRQIRLPQRQHSFWRARRLLRPRPHLQRRRQRQPSARGRERGAVQQCGHVRRVVALHVRRCCLRFPGARWSARQQALFVVRCKALTIFEALYPSICCLCLYSTVLPVLRSQSGNQNTARKNRIGAPMDKPQKCPGCKDLCAGFILHTSCQSTRLVCDRQPHNAVCSRAAARSGKNSHLQLGRGQRHAARGEVRRQDGLALRGAGRRQRHHRIQASRRPQRLRQLRRIVACRHHHHCRHKQYCGFCSSSGQPADCSSFASPSVSVDIGATITAL